MSLPDVQLPPLILDILRVCLWLAVLVAIFVPLERLFAIRPKHIFRKQIGLDLGYFFLSGLVPVILLSGPIGVLAWAVHRVMPESFLTATAHWPFWGRAMVAFVASEIGYYWGHRMTHVIPFLWRFHSIHHSAEHVDFLVNSRAHPIDMVFTRFCAVVPIYVLGLGAPTDAVGDGVVVLVTLVSIVWGFFIHANLRWRYGFLEWLVTTPGFHHWHHTKSGPINKNYSSTLPWLDWIFGTHHLPDEWPTDYGIKAKLPDTLAGQLTFPLTAEPEAFYPPQAPATPPETANGENSASPPAVVPAATAEPVLSGEPVGLQETH